jgi:tetratricopeptide (TPR) repeat protein
MQGLEKLIGMAEILEGVYLQMGFIITLCKALYCQKTATEEPLKRSKNCLFLGEIKINVYYFIKLPKKGNPMKKNVLLAFAVLVLFACAKTSSNSTPQDFTQFDLAYKNATVQMQNGNPIKALEVIESTMKGIEAGTGKRVFFSDDSANVYRYFHNAIEEVLYRELIHGDSKRVIQELPESFFLLYAAHGGTLVELDRSNEAKAPLLKAFEINPIDTDVLFELGVVSQDQKDWKEFFRLTQEAHKVSYTKKDLARCYRNFGYYFIEQEQFDDAIAMYYASLFFDPKQIKRVQQELGYIQYKTKKEIVQPSEEQILAVFEKNNMKSGVDGQVFKIIYAMGKMLEEEKEYDKAKDCYKVLFELTGIEEFKELIENMPK